MKWDDGGFLAQRLAIWNVDLLPEPVVECLCSDVDLPAPHIESPEVDGVWMMLGGRQTEIQSGTELGPLILLQLIQSTWDSLGPGFEFSEVEGDSRLRMLKTFFAWVTCSKGWESASDLAAEHHGSSFQMTPSRRRPLS